MCRTSPCQCLMSIVVEPDGLALLESKRYDESHFRDPLIAGVSYQLRDQSTLTFVTTTPSGRQIREVVARSTVETIYSKDSVGSASTIAFQCNTIVVWSLSLKRRSERPIKMSATDPLDIANAQGCLSALRMSIARMVTKIASLIGEKRLFPIAWIAPNVEKSLTLTSKAAPRGGFGITCDRERVQSNWFQIDGRLLRAACHACGSSSPGMERSWDLGVYALARRF